MNPIPVQLTASQAARLLDVDTMGLRRLLVQTDAPLSAGRTAAHPGWRIEGCHLVCHLLARQRLDLAQRLAELLCPAPPTPEPDIDLTNVRRIELNLSAAYSQLDMSPETLRRLLVRTPAPPGLQRRTEGPPWRLDSHSLARHLQSCRPALAQRLVEGLRGG